MPKAKLLAELKSEQERFEQLLGQIGENRMEEPGVAGEWSIKDVVAHLAAWRRRTVGRLEAAAKSQPEPPPPWPAELRQDDEINAWFYARDRDKSVRQVLSESRQVFEQLVSAIERLPEDALDDPNRFPWMEGNAFSGAALYSHFHEEHEADMRAVVSRSPARS